MSRHNQKKCDDQDDAARMCEVILRKLGYNDVQKGTCAFDVTYMMPKHELLEIARYAERIARWARTSEGD